MAMKRRYCLLLEYKRDWVRVRTLDNVKPYSEVFTELEYNASFHE
jgi:hypothetical protein